MTTSAKAQKSEKLAHEMTIEEALSKHKGGNRIILGDPRPYDKEPEEREANSAHELQIAEAIFKHELEKGGVVIENGIYKKTDKCGELPRFRNKSDNKSDNYINIDKKSNNPTM